MDVYIIVSNLAEQEQSNLCYEEAHACHDDSIGREVGQLVCNPLQ
jgi:hypothetical protein